MLARLTAYLRRSLEATLCEWGRHDMVIHQVKSGNFWTWDGTMKCRRCGYKKQSDVWGAWRDK